MERLCNWSWFTWCSTDAWSLAQGGCPKSCSTVCRCVSCSTVCRCVWCSTFCRGVWCFTVCRCVWRSTVCRGVVLNRFPAALPTHMVSTELLISGLYVGLARTIWIRCVYGTVGREITEYTVSYTVSNTVYIHGSGQPYLYDVMSTRCSATISSYMQY